MNVEQTNTMNILLNADEVAKDRLIVRDMICCLADSSFANEMMHYKVAILKTLGLDKETVDRLLNLRTFAWMVENPEVRTVEVEKKEQRFLGKYTIEEWDNWKEEKEENAEEVQQENKEEVQQKVQQEVQQEVQEEVQEENTQRTLQIPKNEDEVEERNPCGVCGKPEIGGFCNSCSGFSEEEEEEEEEDEQEEQEKDSAAEAAKADEKDKEPLATPSKNKHPAAKALRKLFRHAGLEPEKYQFDTESYPKAILVKGNTKPIKLYLLSMGGKWNKDLNAWVFSKEKVQQVISKE